MRRILQTRFFFTSDSESPFYRLLLSVLVSLLLFLVQSTPHFAKLLSDLAKGNVGVFFLDLGAVFLGEQHEATKLLLSSSRGTFL